tara:strand:- start:17 stop:439 length:423 start_codon:yes stop_codon:yes gene_type:complete
MKLILPVSLGILLTGCITFPSPSQEDILAMNFEELCLHSASVYYEDDSINAAYAELKANHVTAKELRWIQKEAIAIGMTQKVLFCARGATRHSTDMVSQYGTSRVLRYGPESAVYLHDGKVTSWYGNPRKLRIYSWPKNW